MTFQRVLKIIKKVKSAIDRRCGAVKTLWGAILSGRSEKI